MMLERKSTLKEDLLNRGAKGRFYLDTTKQTQTKRAYEVLDIIEDTSGTFSTGVEMRVNLYVEGNKESVNWSLNLADHLNDPRTTRRICRSVLRY